MQLVSAHVFLQHHEHSIKCYGDVMLQRMVLLDSKAYQLVSYLSDETSHLVCAIGQMLGNMQ